MGLEHGEDAAGRKAPPRHDLWIGAIMVSAIVLFVATGSAVLSKALSAYVSGGPQIDQALVIALLLNVALILFGWRRHRELSTEVAVRTAAEQRAHLLAARDPLTGFLNRRSLAEEGGTMLVNAARRYKAVALVMIDLDHFKAINDLHGHAVGDVLLRQVAAAIAEVLPNGAVSARIGGDEFACTFLFDSGHPGTVERVVERTISKLAQPFDCEGLLLNISASAGIARSDQGCTTIDALLRAADTALYAAKNAGRNRFAWFDRSMEREQEARLALEAGLRRAIQRHEIVPYFEQQIDLATGALCGFEVLARWEQPGGTVIAPAMFMQIAERTGMIADLSLSVMRQAFLAARDWDPALTLSVNLGPRQLKDTWLAQKIIKVLTETAFPPSRLQVEVTEAALFDNLSLVQSILVSLKNQGVVLVLDDFGNGFSSLAHLRAAPFDRIKISHAFIGAMSDDPDRAVTVNAVALLGECFNLPITAVGIESASAEERLRGLGVARGQGYHYALPASIANTRRLLGQRGLLRQASAPIGETRRNLA
jgi:diguanylate cyclase (GGDEF)-like protein